MKKDGLMKVGKSIQFYLSNHSPAILTGIGIAGMVSTTVFAVRVTPKALRLINQAENEKNDDLTKTEIVKTCWRIYIPAVVTGAASIACLIGANSVHTKRNAALAAAYTLSDTAFREYKEKVIETIGEEKERIVKEKVSEEKLKKDPVTKKEVYITDKGDILCYDIISGRYFTSNRDIIMKAENIINRQIVNDMYASLNDFYSEIGLSSLSIGDELGWNIDDGQIEIDFDSLIADDGRPCLVVDYNVSPKRGYDRFM